MLADFVAQFSSLEQYCSFSVSSGPSELILQTQPLFAPPIYSIHYFCLMFLQLKSYGGLCGHILSLGCAHNKPFHRYHNVPLYSVCLNFRKCLNNLLKNGIILFLTVLQINKR